MSTVLDQSVGPKDKFCIVCFLAGFGAVGGVGVGTAVGVEVGVVGAGWLWWSVPWSVGVGVGVVVGVVGT